MTISDFLIEKDQLLENASISEVAHPNMGKLIITGNRIEQIPRHVFCNAATSTLMDSTLDLAGLSALRTLLTALSCPLNRIRI